MIRWIKAVSVLLALCSCRADREPEAGPAAASSEAKGLIVNMEGLYLRAEPGPNGAVVEALAPGLALEDLGGVSPFTTRIKLRGVTMNEPWLYVRTGAGAEGWVYGGLLHFSDLPEEQREALLHRKRLAALLDPALADTLALYQELYTAAPTDRELHRSYQLGQRIREALISGLEGRQPLEAGAELPDLFWLEALLPGYLPQLVAEGTAYYFFADYGQWLRRAQATRGAADDAFFELCIAAFPEDSIEYFYPAWTIQTWDYGGHSLLGRGMHRELLRRIEGQLKAGSPFAPELQAFADRLVDDIILPQNSYWEDTTLIIPELEAVLADSLRFLLPRDRIAIEGRLDQFRDPETFDLRVNLRAGDY